MLEKVLDQLGELRFSQHHYVGYSTLKPTLRLLLTRIHSNAIFETRRDENIEGFTNGCFTLDYDGDRAGYEELLMSLELEDISYIAYPSPSRKKGMAKGMFKTRVVIPITGEYSHETYKLQYTQSILDLGVQHLVDNSVNHLCQYYYPPVMGRIGEPKKAEPKPRDYTLHQAMQEVEFYLGEPFKLPTTFSDEALEINRSKRVDGGKRVKFTQTPRTPFYVDDATPIFYQGERLGAFAQVVKDFRAGVVGERCDCPFPNCDKHSNDGMDYGLITDGGIVCRGDSATAVVDGKEYNHRDLILKLRSTAPLSNDEFDDLSEVL